VQRVERKDGYRDTGRGDNAISLSCLAVDYSVRLFR
jgi:hypothetical protein